MMLAWLAQCMDIALHLIIAQVRTAFPVSLDFFRVFSFFQTA